MGVIFTNQRRVLCGVSKVGTECHYFPSSFKVCIDYLDREAGRSYAFVDGVSGAAFGLTWKSLDAIQSDITDYVRKWQEPVIRSFDSVGYNCRVILSSDETEARHTYKQNIIQSIDEGYPVLAKGVFGPPTFGIITGYDDGGDTLIGTNFFQNFFDHVSDPEFPQFYRQKEWNLEDPCLVLFDGKKDIPTAAQVYLRTLEWAVRLARNERLPNHPDIYSGCAAYEKCAEDLVNDPVFTDRDKCGVYLDSFGGFITTMYGRFETSKFLESAADHFPEASQELKAAARCHGRIWTEATLKIYCPDVNEESVLSFMKPETRHENARLLLFARDLDLEASRHIEDALKKIAR